MADVHTNPEEAIRMQKELHIKTGIGIHFGSFALAQDDQDDPIQDLNQALK
jgi:L-ascorbate metabolism protein UlaG (beta-lactamase superfamily)